MPVRGDEIDADYWWRNVREPVRFADGVARLLGDGCTALVEIGPHPVMAAALAEIALAAKVAGRECRLTAPRLRTRGARCGSASRSSTGAARPCAGRRSTPGRRVRSACRRIRGNASTSGTNIPKPRANCAARRRIRLLGDRQPHPQPTG